MFMLNSNEPIKVSHLQELANQSMLNGALVKTILSVKARKIWLFDKTSNALIEKNNRDMGSEKYILLEVFQKCKRTTKLLMFRSDFRKKALF